MTQYIRFDVKWPQRPPTEIKNPVIANVIRGLARKGKSRPEEIVAAAKTVYRHLPKPVDNDVALQNVLDLTMTVNNIWMRTKSGVRMPSTYSALETCVHFLMLNDVKNDLADLRQAYEKITALQGQLPTSNPGTDLFYMKLDEYQSKLSTKIGTLVYVLSINMGGSGKMLETLAGQINLEQEAQTLVGSMQDLRKYGLKTAYFQDGKTHNPAYAWLFWDFSIFKHPERSTFGAIKPLAAISLARKSVILSKKHLSMVTHEELHASLSGSGLTDMAHLNIPSALMWTINKDGHLEDSFDYGLVPVKKIFTDVGKEAEYELLRMLHLLRLYDLVVPITLVSQAPKLPMKKNIIGRIADTIAGNDRQLLPPSLIIPRVKLLGDRKFLLSEIEKEVESAEIDTIERSRREMRKHEVVGHVRKLVPGYHASQKAIQAAEEIGVKLADNETFVAKHTRGSGEFGGIHKGKNREN